MNPAEKVSNLSHLTNPSEVIFTVTMQDILAEIARRMGEKAHTLSAEELQLARDEVQAAIEQHLDIREYINMGLDAWEIVRSL
jgi:hypothetical protein